MREKAKYEEMAQEDKQRFNKQMEEYSAKSIAAKPPTPVIPEHNRQAYAHQAVHAATAATHAAYHPDPQQQHYNFCSKP